MSGFLEALAENPFMRNALVTALLASVACGVVGTYVVTRRIIFIAGSIAHCVLGGMGAARYLQQVHGLVWLHPFYGAVASALAGAVVIGLVSLRAREREDTLLERGYSPEYITKAKQFLKDPGISVLKEAMIACDIGGVHAMHDPTEGGLTTGMHEMARCSQTGMAIWPEKIHIFAECKELCHEFGIDPMGVIASGGLLMAVEPSYSASIIDKLARDNIHCSIIGQVVEEENGLFFHEEQKKRPIPTFETDEITKIFP